MAQLTLPLSPATAAANDKKAPLDVSDHSSKARRNSFPSQELLLQQMMRLPFLGPGPAVESDLSEGRGQCLHLVVGHQKKNSLRFRRNGR